MGFSPFEPPEKMAQNGWLRDIGDEILPSYTKIISEANYFGIPIKQRLGGGFKYFFFSPLFGEDSRVVSYFSDGVVQPPRPY